MAVRAQSNFWVTLYTIFNKDQEDQYQGTSMHSFKDSMTFVFCNVRRVGWQHLALSLFTSLKQHCASLHMQQTTPLTYTFGHKIKDTHDCKSCYDSSVQPAQQPCMSTACMLSYDLSTHSASLRLCHLSLVSWQHFSQHASLGCLQSLVFWLHGRQLSCSRF